MHGDIYMLNYIEIVCLRCVEIAISENTVEDVFIAGVKGMLLNTDRIKENIEKYNRKYTQIQDAKTLHRKSEEEMNLFLLHKKQNSKRRLSDFFKYAIGVSTN
jgi:hypothetical protein